MLRNPHCWPLLHGSWHSNAQPFAEMKRWMQRCNCKISKKNMKCCLSRKKDLSKVKSGIKNWYKLISKLPSETSLRSVEIPAFKPVLWSFSASWSTAMLEGAQTKTCWNGHGRLSDTVFFFRPLRQYKRYKRWTKNTSETTWKKFVKSLVETTSLNWIEQKHVYIPGLTLILPSEVENNGGTGHSLSSSWKLSL